MGLTDLGMTDDPLGSKTKQKKAWLSDEKLFEIASEFYYHMWNESYIAEFPNDYSVWEGSMSQWFIDNGVKHLYSPVTKVLYAAGCINLASRGGGGKPSLVHLHRAPTLKEVANLRANEYFFERDALTGKAKERRLEQMVNDHREQIADLLARVERLERG